jgi:hypothetical protein
MKGDRLINASDEALNCGGVIRLAGVWLSALAESVRSGPSERVRPAASWRRGGNWGRASTWQAA